MSSLSRFVLYSLFFFVGLLLLAFVCGVVVIGMITPQLPSLEVLTDYRPRIPLRIYTADGHLIGEFGEERRSVVRFSDVPQVLKNAILAAEDDRFYQHRGVDYQSIARAFLKTATGSRQGGSTITQQVAKNFFLTPEQTLKRKLYEALLSFKIENNLSKDQIFELYINQIYLGQKAYGFAAAARAYFGKPLSDITIAEAAMLAGLPKSPAKCNPIKNPKCAQNRQNYVLNRMTELGQITTEERELARHQELVLRRDNTAYAVPAEYVAEMARQMAADLYKDDVYTQGYSVYTTILKEDQMAAYAALRKNVLNYDSRHGYRGAETYLDLSHITSDQDIDALDDLLQEVSDSDDFHPAIVLEAKPKEVSVYRYGGEVQKITGDGLKLAARLLDAKAPEDKKLRRGALIRIREDGKDKWKITQLPEVESAFVAIDPKDGRVRALVGGFDFAKNKFNHVTQAWRQPGSSFKPFIYSGALEKGYTPASIVPDEPLAFSASVTGGKAWTPKNYDGKFEGPMSLRTALAKSKNMVSIRILEGSGVSFIQDYVTRFGFDADKHPPYLTMALGAGSVTPWQMVSAYAVFANGGHFVSPHIVQEINDRKGQVLAKTTPLMADQDAPYAIDPRNAFIMDSMMRDVTLYGTAGRASALLKRRDLAGKTGTTNEHIDAWFCGYQQTVVGCTWIGFDQPRSMGAGETGGTAALPAWIDYMAVVLKDVPQTFLPQPEGVANVEASGARKELFYTENVPDVIEEEPPQDPNHKPVD